MDNVLQFINQNEMIQDGSVVLGVLTLLFIICMLIPKIERVLTIQIMRRTLGDFNGHILKVLAVILNYGIKSRCMS